MTRLEERSELSLRWSEWQLRRNQRGMRGVLWIVLCLSPALGMLEHLVAPDAWLPWFHVARASATLVTLALFPAVPSAVFRRYPNAISAGYMLLVSLGISLLTVFTGGLASPYSVGLSLLMLASGLLFVWRPRVAAATHAGIVLGFLAPNLVINEAHPVLTAVSNPLFLLSTALIAGTGQMLAFRSQREQLSAELAREEAARNLERAHQRLERLSDGLDPNQLDESRLRLRVKQQDLVAHLEPEALDDSRLIDIDDATDQPRPEADEDEHRREHCVLVVEDAPEVARVIRLALRRDYRILIASDGQQGLELARRQRPSIVITDWMMPKLDGLELTRQLRHDLKTRHIPIVMLSARSDLDDKLRGLETGVSAYLSKPFAASELISTVRSLLRSQDAAADTLLAQKMDSLEAIAGGLAHEILNPLNYLTNALTIAQDDSQSLALAVRDAANGPPASGIVRRIDRMQEMFAVSRAGVKRIAGTVDLMVRYSRDGYARSPSPYDAYAAARDVAAVVGASVARDVPIVLDLEGDGWIDCVAEEFNQVLSNLIQNALEAAAKGPSGRVIVRGRNEGAELRLSVRDNGPGIAESERARIFDAFYTTKQAGHGMGLGLTITRRVVVGLGGSLRLESELGKGSEFIIRVPSSLGYREAAS
jgi:signal transduction histidine kinase